MTPLDLQAIYNFIPAVYRTRDVEAALDSGITLDPADQQTLNALLAKIDNLSALEQQQLAELQDKQQRGPLKSLAAILAEQVEVLQESLYQSYDDLFIETCQEWVVPYIGELVGFPGLADFPGTPYSLRAAVAETIRTRRRKGTVSGLETVASSVSGWPARAVEYFLLLATTQFMNHIRPQNLSWADVRNADRHMLNTPFDATAHTADVRRISTVGGKYNIPNVGIWLWRLEPMRLEESPAFRVDSHRFLFDALGRDTQLFTLPQPVDEKTGRATPLNVPMPITRWMFHGARASYYGHDLSFFVDQSGLASPAQPLKVRACNLSDVKDSQGKVTGWAHTPRNHIAIDPELGRIALPASVTANQLHVSYTYAFPAEMGGGPYSRPFDDTADVVIEVPREFATLGTALTRAGVEFGGGAKSVVILISSNDYFIETPQVNLPKGASLEIRAADSFRPVLVLSGDFNIYGAADSSFSLDGLLVSGGCLNVPAFGSTGLNELTELTVSHCTLAPMAAPAIGPAPAQAMGPRLCVEAEDLVVAIDHIITGPLRIRSSSSVTIESSIVDSGSPSEIAYADETCTGSGGALTVTNTTIIGQVHTRLIELASNTIFDAVVQLGSTWNAPVTADQLQQGCVRFSYVPPGSRVPRPYNCYPGPNTVAPLVPAFTSRRFGDAGYCQLARLSGTAILQGADDGSEMGAYHDLHQPQRIANLQVMLQDNLRFGLESGIFFAS
jgi:hypothetical protein